MMTCNRFVVVFPTQEIGEADANSAVTTTIIPGLHVNVDPIFATEQPNAWSALCKWQVFPNAPQFCFEADKPCYCLRFPDVDTFVAAIDPHGLCEDTNALAEFLASVEPGAGPTVTEMIRSKVTNMLSNAGNTIKTLWSRFWYSNP